VKFKCWERLEEFENIVKVERTLINQRKHYSVEDVGLTIEKHQEH
jgi:hypothetical protein